MANSQGSYSLIRMITQTAEIINTMKAKRFSFVIVDYLNDIRSGAKTYKREKTLISFSPWSSAPFTLNL